MFGAYSNLKNYQQGLYDGKYTCVEITRFYLEKIKKENPRFNAFLETFDESALEKAEEVDKKIKNGNAGRLAGLIFGIKDLFCYRNHHLSCGSKILDNFTSKITATAVTRILEQDAILIGRQNCDEFAMGSSNENSAFGNVYNSHDTSRVPGGSSGGSAVAVAADLCMMSLGSDTGGSIRQPASFCGIVGLKPTYSRISRFGLTSYCSSLDTVGILSKSIEDTAIILEVIAGKDENDHTSSSLKVDQYSQFTKDEKPVKIALIKNFHRPDGLDPAVNDKFNEIILQLKSKGHSFQEVDFPYEEFLLPTYYLITASEASTNLSRYDGVRYGLRSSTKDLETMYKKTRTDGFGKEVKRRIMLGSFALSASHKDDFYIKAHKSRYLIKQFTKKILQENDFIILPTTPSTAFKINEKAQNPLQMYLSDLFTVQASLAGISAISIPVGKDEKGLPIGLQILADSFCEKKLLNFSEKISKY